MYLFIIIIVVITSEKQYNNAYVKISRSCYVYSYKKQLITHFKYLIRRELKKKKKLEEYVKFHASNNW